ncbi:hypothetical protein L6164_033279 [Bauhinia variegata]|uniref:Uncharacterized protein n=1 Tax=Bauhinia variegata TaxID=167791 RepID=A0ACB9KRA9_BAUVA|nr:hypothetical protein L6164_033279 [Bauhinia variegata]
MIDASIDEFVVGGIGGVLCGANGAYLPPWANKISSPISVQVLEVLEIREAIILLQSWGYNHISVEGDYLEVMSHLQRRRQIRLSLGAITNDILEIVSFFSICNFKWIPRLKNHMAHTLAKYDRRVDTLACWMDTPPMCISYVFAALIL